MENYFIKSNRPSLQITNWVVLLLVRSVWDTPEWLFWILATLLGMITIANIVGFFISKSVDAKDLYFLINKK